MYRGWAEEHPAAVAGIVPRTLVLVYAPRNEMELEITMRLVEASRKFALGAIE
jgi:hypothetical protein